MKRTFFAALTLVLVIGAGYGQETVRVVFPYYSSATAPFFEAVVEGFEAEYPDIDIELTEVNWDTLLQKLTTDIAGGQAPDVAVIGTRWLTDFVNQGVAEPLEPHLSDDVFDRFIPAFLGPSELEGATYGLPMAASARAMFYNSALLDRAGVADPPATWEEAVEVAQAIKDLDDSVYGFGLQAAEIETDVYFYYAMWSFGGDILEEDGTSGLDAEPAFEAARLYKRMIDEGLTQPGPTAYSRENVQDLFKQGRVGFMFSAPFLIGQIENEAPDLEYGIAPIPSAETQVTYGVTDSIMMFADSERKEAAAQFLEYLFRADVHLDFTVAEGFLPVLEGEADSDYFQTNDQLRIFADLLPNAKFAPNIEGWGEVADTTTTALQGIYLGDRDVEPALQDAARRIDRQLRR
jgi:multiple sugar transport system substrate-binding protein